MVKRFRTVLLLLLIALPAFAQRSPNREELVRAEYGWGNSWVGVTERVRSLMHGHSLHFRADNQTLGVDPRPGKDKTLRLYLRDEQGNTRTVTFRENDDVQLQPIYSGTSRDRGRGRDRRYGGLQILRATYGYGNRSIDVTDRLRQQVQNGQIDLRVTNDTMGGDPAVGRTKTLTVETMNNGQTSQMIVNEGDYLRLSGFDDDYQDEYQGSLQILRGTYGYGDRFIDVTDRLRQQVSNGQINLRVTNDTMGGDPAVGRTKTLTVDSRYNGQTNRTVVSEGDYLRLSGGDGESPDGYYRDGYQGRLRIMRATYGDGNRSIDVTDRIQQQVRNDQLNLRVTNDTMGGDPAVNRDKWLTIQSTYNGRRSRTMVKEGDYLRLPDSSQGSNGGYGGAYAIIPRGTELTIRTNEAIDSKTARAGETFSASMAEDVRDSTGAQTIRRGSDVSLVIRNASGSDLVLDIDSLTVDGERYYVSTQDLERTGRDGLGANRRTAVMVGGGSAVGAVIGAIIGGGNGAAIGAGVGAAGGAIGEVLTGGKAVRVPAETVLSFRLDQDLRLE